MKCINCGSKTDNPKFCSRSCGVSFNNKVKPKRIKRLKKCLCCSTEFHAINSKSQKYCSRKCHEDYKNRLVQTEGFPPSWNSNQRIRRYLKNKHGNFCMICGQSGNDWNGQPMTLIVDHINGKSNDNTLENLRIVCPNCDSQLPTYKAKNKGNSTRTYTITQK